jgi:deazaflavin-dependent oxidoreductase (nitroreductase family)
VHDPSSPAGNAGAGSAAAAGNAAASGNAAPAGNPAAAHFQRKRPGWFTKNVFNRMLNGLMGLGFSVWGSRVLEVRGRSSGEPRRTPVNLLSLDGKRFLVAPRGETQWVRNLRAAGEGRLVLGRRSEPFKAEEVVSDAEKVPILRAYLARWKAEVGVFFDGVGPDSPESELREAAAKHPVFGIAAPTG